MPEDKEFELDDLESFSFDDLSLDDAPRADGEQDPEGVWVKSAPEDVGSDAAEVAAMDAPASEAPVSDELPEEDFLSSEELANLDDSFDFVTVDEPQEGEAPMDDEVAFLDTPEAVAAEKAGNFDEVSLDDFVSFEDDAKTETILDPIIDTPAEPEDDFPEEFLDLDIDIDDEIDDEILEVATPPKAVASAPTDNVEAEDIDLSEFGDFEEVTPNTELPSLDDLDLPPLDTPALADDSEGFFEEEVFDDPGVHVQLEPDDSTDMDHILALEEDLTAGIREPDAAPASAAAPGGDLAAAILGKIEQELSSIKQEITALKQEVTQMRAAPVAESAVTDTLPEAADGEPKVSHGFFDDDDDEAIALTGDELDNILSMAEVSEGEEAGVSLEDDLLDMDAEGNLVETEASAASIEDAPDGVELDHVTDEEFLAGTALDLNEPDPFDVHNEVDAPGIPDSIELEEDLPLGLEDETDDLLTTEDDAALFSEAALAGEPELDIDDAGILGDEPETLPPFEPEAVSLEPDLMSGTSLEPDMDDLAEEPAAVAEPALPSAPPAPAPAPTAAGAPLATGLKDELRAVLSYMDKLLASLPDDKIQEFAESEHFEVYKRLFEELGLIE